MNPESNHEQMNEAESEQEERTEIKPVKLTDARGRQEWLSKEEEQEVAGFKISNNARHNLEFLSSGLEHKLPTLRWHGTEVLNALHLVKMLEGIAEDFANLELTDAQRKLIMQVVDALERRVLDNRNEEDTHLREDITAVRLKVEENQLVDVFGEIGFHIDGLKGA